MPEGKNFFWSVWKRLLPGGMTWELEEICTDKKENQIFLIYKEIQNGAVTKPNMRKGFLIYE